VEKKRGVNGKLITCIRYTKILIIISIKKGFKWKPKHEVGNYGSNIDGLLVDWTLTRIHMATAFLQWA